MKKITVLGDGAWGTAIAQLLATNNHTVTLWCYNKSVAEEINNLNINSKYLSNIKLSKLINASTNLIESIDTADIIFEAIPVSFLRSILENCKNNIKETQKWVILSKGIENNTLLFPSEIIEDILNFKPEIAVLSGPSFAMDLSEKQPTCVNIASNNILLSQELFELLKNNFFYPVIIKDIKAIQICAAFKNIIGLTVGILEGAGYKENTKAYVITKAIQELKDLLKLYNCDSSILLEACGIGDIFLTAGSKASRNTQAGLLLGRGNGINFVLSQGLTIEGINSVLSFYQLVQELEIISKNIINKKYNSNFLFIKNLYKYLFKDGSILNLI